MKVRFLELFDNSAKNLFNFESLSWKLDNPYCHGVVYSIIDSWKEGQKNLIQIWPSRRYVEDVVLCMDFVVPCLIYNSVYSVSQQNCNPWAVHLIFFHKKTKTEFRTLEKSGFEKLRIFGILFLWKQKFDFFRYSFCYWYWLGKMFVHSEFIFLFDFVGIAWNWLKCFQKLKKINLEQNKLYPCWIDWNVFYSFISREIHLHPVFTVMRTK